MYLNCLCYQIALREIIFTQREWGKVLTGYLSVGCRPGGDWANTSHLTQRFTIFCSNRKQLLSDFLPYLIPRGGLY